ncbi:hypothetical protein [Actinomadura algeriensis]|uniref:Uncharacterized protein n=1 Tax=Actinomadura algeriensis TaxID=1679523 RepID=A0ABR9JYS5_9ACTN|nr:hypothetical protein [Actinomadura algeriensis]MBE1535718.1 hypothetical protein [Actinomadura algeriensis]
MQLNPPPRIPAKELRPGRYWYFIAVAIAVVLIGLGLAIPAYRLNNATDAVDTDHQFANGDTVTLRLEPESEKAIWVKFPGRSPGPECDIVGQGDPGLIDPGTDVFLIRDESWYLLYTFDVPQAGDYKVTCSSKALSRYAIGDTGGLFTFVGGLISAVVLSILGMGIGVVIVILTAVRRRGHHKRLRAGSGSPDLEPAV